MSSTNVEELGSDVRSDNQLSVRTRLVDNSGSILDHTEPNAMDPTMILLPNDAHVASSTVFSSKSQTASSAMDGKK